MGRSRKHQHQLPSVIDSDCSSLHDNNSSGSDSQSDTVLVPTDHPTGTGAVTGKCSKARRKTINKTQDPTAPIPKLDYILTLFSATEMKKSATKYEPKKSSLQLSADEPWDTVKAQILITKIDEVLKPSTLSIDNYEVLFTIPCVVSKPGYPLASTMVYSILLDRSAKSKLVQLSISTVDDDGNKENEEVDNAAAEKLKKKKAAILPPFQEMLRK